MARESIQALSALSRAAEVTSANLANVDTPGYRARRVHLEDGEGGEGVRVAPITLDSRSAADRPDHLEPAGGDPAASSVARPRSGVDVGREVVDLIRTQNAFAANAAQIRAWDQVTGLVVNLKA
jgi:flagellar basal-body rod protein FlgC